MSSVRIGQHNRDTAVPASPGSVTAKGEAPSGGVGFALALGAAALAPKDPGVAPFGAATRDTADETSASRKRAGGDRKSDEAAAMLAAQTSLLAVVGQVPVPSHDAVDARPTPSVASTADPENAVAPGPGQPGANFAPISIAPAADVAKSMSPPGNAMIAAAANLASDTQPVASVTDAGTPGSTPGDAAVDPSPTL